MQKAKRDCCGCIVLIVLLLLALCALLAWLAFVRPRSAHAQVAGANCVASTGASTLQLAPGIPESRSADVARGVFFQNETVITTTGHECVCLASSPDGRGDLRVDDRLELNVVHADASAGAWQHDFGNPPSGGITTGPPQDVSSLFTLGVDRVRLTLRDTRPPVFSARPVWLIVFALPPPIVTPSPSPTAAPVTLTPSVLTVALTAEPTQAIPTPLPTSTLLPVVAANKPRTSAFPWLLILIGCIILAITIGLIVIRRAPRSAPSQKKQAPGGDEGSLEICDTQTGDVQRIELSELGLGEVWGIGNSPNCRIHAGRETGEEEYAALVLTPDGPMIKSRGKPIWFDDNPITEHLLFDGDDIYVGRFVLGYQNFFRRRGVNLQDDAQEEIGET